MLSITAASTVNGGVRPGVRVEFDGDRLSLAVQNQPLSLVLDELSRQGVRIRIDPTINPEITASFEYRPIGRAISSVLKTVDYALIWGTGGRSGSGEPRLVEIQIFRPGQQGSSQPVYRSPNLSVAQGRNNVLFVENSLPLIYDQDFSEEDLALLLARIGGVVIEHYPHLGIVRLHLPDGMDIEQAAEIVGLLPGIQGAEPDYVHPLLPTIGEQVVGHRVSEPSGDDVGGTTVAVMDSGLSSRYNTSPFIAGIYDAVAPGRSGVDPLGHGTQMALVASGAVVPLGADSGSAENTPVLAIRAFDDNGYTSNSTLLRGIDYAVKNGARVVSLSWGTSRSSGFLDSVMAYAATQGLIVVAAAGNQPTGKPVYPAAHDTVIGVGALNSLGEPWSQTNYGDFVSAYAPGLADLPIGSGGEPGVYGGTSIATAYTARRIAQILNQSPDADRATILRRMLNRSR